MNSIIGTAMIVDITEEESSISESQDGTITKNASNSDDIDDLPKEVYIKGFFAFVLWGFIPPDGREQYTSALITVVNDTKSKTKKEDSRNAVKKAEANDKEYMRSLEVRGNRKAANEEGELFNKIADLDDDEIKLEVNKLKDELKETRQKKKYVYITKQPLYFTSTILPSSSKAKRVKSCRSSNLPQKS